MERENRKREEEKEGGRVEKARKVIMAAVIGVMFGYLLIWIVMPTSTYSSSWLPHLQTLLQSTYLGSLGMQLLIYTFPVLFVAVLGSLYLHLGNKSQFNFKLISKEKEKRGRLTRWRRPVLVRGPLGIVSGIELSFLIMFIALLVWSLSTYLHVGYYNITPDQIEQDGGHRWKAKWGDTVYWLGIVGNIGLTLLFFPVTRGSSILPMLGLTSEGSIKYHIWVGHFVMAFFTTHGLGFILLWALNGQLSEALKWDKVGVSIVAGELSLLFGLILWIATYPTIRRKLFEVFFYTHQLYILFIIFFIFHVGISYTFYMLPGFYLFMIDRYLRFLQSRCRVRLISTRALPCDALELNFVKSLSLSYSPTSIIFINVPRISKLQWHPFTITSNSKLEIDRLSVVVKVEGSWTRKLYDMIASSSIDRLQVSVEGPYGPPSNHFLRHDMLVMVSGGIGITPFFSNIRELLFTSMKLKCQTPKLLLICAFKKPSDLSLLNLLLPLSTTNPFDISTLNLKIKAYVTRRNSDIVENYINNPPQTICFKPNPIDSPISPTLGKNSWLWLAIIISSSFISFLIIMGIVTLYYIYPIDHNTYEIFSYSKRAFLYIFILCICMAMVAGGVVLWNKKINDKESKQIINKEETTPTGTPEAMFCNVDRELESLPYQSLLQDTEVHYGERPDLKRLLFDCKGSSVGVLVCGPHGMRHEVANICSSGLAENLHFESISFSW